MEKNLKKKDIKKQGKIYKEKETSLKGARGEELIELRLHMTKVIRRSSLGNWVILHFSGQNLNLVPEYFKPNTFQGL